MKNSLLDLVQNLDSFSKTDSIYSFVSHDGIEIGYMLPMVALEFVNHPELVTVDTDLKLVTMRSDLDQFDRRNEVFASVLLKWRLESKFEVLKGWRNELYTVYNPTHVPYMLIERAFSSLLGVITYGVHINGYIPPQLSEDGQLRLWVPRRSYKKPTCPGELDNTVAGGLGYPYEKYETCIKECGEEAGLDEEYTKRNLKSCGVMTYIYQKSHDLEQETALIQPEAEFIYDLTFDNETVPKPVDGEVHEFYLMTMDEVLEKLHLGEFKYNCSGVIIDFLVRHGHLDNEVDLLEIQAKTHRALPFPTI